MCTQEDCVVIWEKERVLGEVAYGLGIVCKFSSCTWLKLLSQFTNNLQNATHVHILNMIKTQLYKHFFFILKENGNFYAAPLY